MVHKCLTHAKNKYTMLSSVWKVFSILLEYCCKSNYQMMISKISTEHQQQMADKEKNFNLELNLLNSHEKDLKEAMDLIQRQNSELTKKLEEETSLRIKL